MYPAVVPFHFVRVSVFQEVNRFGMLFLMHGVCWYGYREGLGYRDRIQVFEMGGRGCPGFALAGECNVCECFGVFET